MSFLCGRHSEPLAWRVYPTYFWLHKTSYSQREGRTELFEKQCVAPVR
jgi:hypothetical protein